jgi:hypothetical protein
MLTLRSITKRLPVAFYSEVSPSSPESVKNREFFSVKNMELGPFKALPS